MKIVILDGHALNPGDVSYDCFKQLCSSLTVYDRTPPELVIDRIGDAECILLNKVKITKEILDACPSLKYIGVLATGYNVIDLQACREKNITVTNIPSYSTNAVAQHVFAFILNFTNLVSSHNESVVKGDWISSPDFCYWISPLQELAGKTIGIYGFGSIGQRVAKLAHAFDMNVIVHVHSPSSFTGGEKTVTADELFANSDFVTLHTPLTSETEKLINSDTLSKMKNTAYLINTARGGLINEADLKVALEQKVIAGYAADVVESEPMAKDNPLYKAPSCVITPHIAWAPLETRQRLLGIATENLKAFISGKRLNVVS